MSIRSLVRVLACACVLALIVAACSGGSDKKTDSTTGKTEIGDPVTYTATSVAKAGTDPCAFIGESQAGALIGGPVRRLPNPSKRAVEPECIWQGTVAGVDYLLQVLVGSGKQFYTGDAAGNQRLDGIGDKAAIRESPLGSEEMISFMRDGVSYTIALAAQDGGKTQLAKGKRDQLISLVKNAANK